MDKKLEFLQVEPPLSGLPPDELAKALDEIGAKARTTYEATSKELLELLSKNDPVAILARMGWRFYAAQAMESQERWPAAEQHHLELLQALALRGLPAPTTAAIREADVVQKLAELLDTNAAAFNLSRINGAGVGSEDKAHLRSSIAEHMRASTQFVRGEFFPDQFARYLGAILHRIDADFAEVHGITGSALFSMLQRLIELIENKLDDFRKRGHRVAKAYKREKAIKAYVEEFPEETGRRDDILAKATAWAVKPHHMRLFLVEEAERFLPQVLSVTDGDIVRACPAGADWDAAKRAIANWSMKFGDLKDRPVEHTYLANPIWDCPFIDLGGGRYLWPSPGTFLTFGFEMFERLIAASADLVRKYEDARAAVLEDELGALLKKFFPNGRVLQGLKWTDSADGKEYENDTVVLIDRTALLLEAKSGKVSAEARRGSDIRLKREIEKLMVDPARQSKRLMDLLSNDRCEHQFRTTHGVETIDSRDIDRFTRVNVTFNPIGAISSRWPELVEAEIIAADAVQVPTMTLADLDLICETLREQATISHYLRRRTEFEANADYRADEYDLLAFYLRTGFNIGETEFKKIRLMIYGMSNELNAYFKRQTEGQRPPPPRPDRSRMFSRLISALEERRQPRWLEAAHRLLSVGVQEQQTIEEHAPAAIARVRNSREPNMSWSAQIATGPPQRREAIVFVWYRCVDDDERRARMRMHAAQAMEMAGTDECLVVGIDIALPHDAYSVLGLAKKQSDEPPPTEQCGAAPDVP